MKFLLTAALLSGMTFANTIGQILVNSVWEGVRTKGNLHRSSSCMKMFMICKQLISAFNMILHGAESKAHETNLSNVNWFQGLVFLFGFPP